MLRVFAQLAPEPTDKTFTVTDRKTGERTVQRWHRARLLEIGYANSFAEAKKLHPHPIVEEVREKVH